MMFKAKQDHSTEDQLHLPLLPLKDIVVFPHMIVPVFINEDLCLKVVEKALSSDRRLFLSAFKVAGIDGAGLECDLSPPFDVYRVGTVCSIMRTRKLPDGRMKVLVQGLQKAKIVGFKEIESIPSASLEMMSELLEEKSHAEVEALIRAVRENLEKVVNLGKILSPDIIMILEDVKDPSRLADLVAANLGFKVEQAQKILATIDPVERLEKVHAYLSREIEVYQMQLRIQSQAKEEITKMQREHYVREQIRVLKNELGDGDPKDEIEELWSKLKALHLDQDTQDEIAKQIRRLERMHQDTSEASLTRSHVETLLSLPWNKETEEKLNLKEVTSVLNEDHFGLDQVKDRILEYLAVRKLNPQAKSPIICFVGPPGVGKTSLGRSIARSMNRKFARISLGGVRDEADIRGHRKTYVGAFPGRIIQGIKSCDSNNPVIMLDEIDKLGHDFRGDPSAALLEVLDPEQNANFVDHYLGVPFDLSAVMFIANANNLDTIPAPLRDRLEIIEVSGYSDSEKVQIANRFLIPKQIKESGLESKEISLTKGSIEYLIRNYTRETGLRGLEKKIASVFRKIARNYAEHDHELPMPAIKVTPHLVQKYLGAQIYGKTFFHAEPAVGVSLGLAYTAMGGEVLAIETNLLKGSSERLILTGHLGDVMKESAQTALSFIKSQSTALGLEDMTFKDKELHVHLPQGAVPKDGPSAGITLVTSMLSALLQAAPKASYAMTGEITLHGKILPIGGLKEKILAAQREGITHVILPEANEFTFEDLDQHVKKNIRPIFVSNYLEAFKVLFPDILIKHTGIKDILKESIQIAS